MFFSDIIKLVEITNSKDEDGFQVESKSEIEVWSNKKSVTRSEFYAASNNKIQISAVFEVHVEDYGNQKNIIYNGSNYEVIRAYQIGEGIIELNCSDKAV